MFLPCYYWAYGSEEYSPRPQRRSHGWRKSVCALANLHNVICPTQILQTQHFFKKKKIELVTFVFPTWRKLLFLSLTPRRYRPPHLQKGSVAVQPLPLQRWRHLWVNHILTKVGGVKRSVSLTFSGQWTLTSCGSLQRWMSEAVTPAVSLGAQFSRTEVVGVLSKMEGGYVFCSSLRSSGSFAFAHKYCDPFPFVSVIIII